MFLFVYWLFVCFSCLVCLCFDGFVVVLSLVYFGVFVLMLLCLCNSIVLFYFMLYFVCY